jgi:hypothetical protein
MKSLPIAVLISSLYAPFAWSQCSGVSTGGGCVPPPCTPGSPLLCNQTPPQGQQQVAPQPQAVWADRWGAVVIAQDTGDAGTATGRASRTEAINASMRDCASHGAKRCQLELAYHNQCAAVAWGATNIYTAGAPTQPLAQSDALKGCTNATTSCKIVYSGCSLAERIK